MDQTKIPVPLVCSYRMVLALVACFSLINLFTMRMGLSVAIVCMVNHTSLMTQDVIQFETSRNVTCGHEAGYTTIKDGEFQWNKVLQGIILGSFFWGYLFTQLLGGWLSDRFGSKRVFGVCMMVTSIASLLTPVAVRGSHWLLITLRFIQGLMQGVAIPTVYNLWSKWAPPLERSKLFGFTYAGCDIGIVIAMPVSGLLCDYGFDGGWPSIFYIYGTAGFLSCILWMVVVSDSPSQHPHISDQERDYIVNSIGTHRKTTYKEGGTPWREILQSVPFWAIVVGHATTCWGLYSLHTNIPTFMKEVNRFNIMANGGLSAIPFIASWACINIAGWVSDRLQTKGWSTLNVRRIMNSAGTVLPAILLVAVGHIPCDLAVWSIVVLTVAVGLSGFSYSGHFVNHVDIASPFAGTLFGMTNTASTLSGILAPYAIGLLTRDQTQAQWQNVFYLAAAMYIAGNIFFCVFASGETQPWANQHRTLPEAEESLQKMSTATHGTNIAAKTDRKDNMIECQLLRQEDECTL